jgi:hypothetical protein
VQLGALAEFRGDWAGALRMYGEAYAYVPQVCVPSAPLFFLLFLQLHQPLTGSKAPL